MTNEEAIAQLRRWKYYEDSLDADEDERRTINALDMAIKALQKRETGKWIWREDEKYYDTPTGNATYECSLCHHSDVHAKTQEVPYCWWCGAKMEVIK